MRKRLEIFGEVRIVDETNGFGPDFVKNMIMMIIINIMMMSLVVSKFSFRPTVFIRV